MDAGPAVHLAAFGKHPGWNDHIDDLGLETDRLIAVKRILYLEGIGAAVDSGAWDKLHETQRVGGFDHVLIWRTAQDTVVARLWSSSDGKGRTKYPMIVCAQLRGVPMRAALERVLPALEAVQRACQATSSADEVRSILASSRDRLRAELAGIPAGEPEMVVPADAIKTLAADPAFSAEGEGLLRILYQVEREMASYLAVVSGGKSRLGNAAGGSKTRQGDLRPQQIRVPACGQAPGETSLKWMRFLLAMLDPASTMVVVVPVGEAWADLIVGEPAGSQFFCIRASPKSIPLTSDIPYTLDAAFVAGAKQLLDSPLPGGDVVIGPSGQSAAPMAGVAAKLGWSRQAKMLGLAIGATVLLGALAVAMWPSSSGGGGEAQAAREQASSASDAARPAERAPSPGATGPALVEGPAGGTSDDGPWRELCGLYQDWAGQFLRKLDEPRRERYRADPTLAKLVACFGAGEARNDPWSIAQVERGPISHLIREPPASVQTLEGVRRTSEALACLKGAGESLSAGGWRLLADLQSAAHGFRERGWTEAHGAVVASIQSVAPQSGADVAAAIDAALELSAAVASVEERWGAIEKVAGELGATGDPVLAEFRRWAAAHGSGAGEMQTLHAAPTSAPPVDAAAMVLGIDRRLAEAQSLGAELARFVASEGWSSVDRDAFAAGSRSHRALASGRAADKGLFRDWLFEAPSYPAPDSSADPRRRWQEASQGRQPAELVAAVAAAEGLRQYLAKHNAAPSEQDGETLRTLDELRTQAAALSSRRWSAADRGDIELQSVRLASRSAELSLALDRRLANLRNQYEQSFAEVVARLRAREAITASAALNEAWRTGRDALIRELSSAADGGNVTLLLERAAAMEDSIDALDRAAPAPELPAGLGAGPWGAAIEAAVAARREEVLREAAGELARGRSAQGLLTGVAERSSQERDRLIALAQQATSLQDMFGGAYGLSERPLGGSQDAGTAGELLARLEGAMAAAPQGVRTAMGPLLERAGQLRAISASQDRGALAAMVQAARADVPEQAVGAWRRLGELSWPRDLAELEQERSLRETLGRVLGTLRDPARREQLQAELAAEALARFERAAAGLSQAEQMESALAMLDGFGLSAGQLSNAGLRFNAMLLGLRQELSREGVDEAGAREVVARFVAAAKAEVGGALAPGSRAQGVVRQFEEAIANAGKPQERPRVDLSTVGPGALGGAWQTEVLHDGAEVVYRHGAAAGAKATQPIELRFVRVVTAEGAGAYLLANELSVGQFIAIVESLGEWGDLSGLVQTFIATTDPRRGPRGWEWEENSRGLVLAIRPSGSWLRRSHSMGATPYYPEAGEPGKPTAEHPLQRIPPDAAVYVAALVGCRLPTSAEWKGAYETSAREAPLESWNLRDAAWKRQQGYVEEVRRSGKVPEWPDEGIFWPGGSRSEQRALNAQTHDWDDGWLWFAPVASPAAGVGGAASATGMTHLVGNVAELVFEDPAVFAGLAAPEPEVIRTLLEASSSRLGVIGGSALSAPETPLDLVQPVDLDEALELGFADVGIRLAFAVDGAAAGPSGVLGAAKWLLRSKPYVLAE